MTRERSESARERSYMKAIAKKSNLAGEHPPAGQLSVTCCSHRSCTRPESRRVRAKKVSRQSAPSRCVAPRVSLLFPSHWPSEAQSPVSRATVSQVAQRPCVPAITGE